MDLDLKNLKIDDIKAKILSMADKKTLIKFGIGIGSIVFFLIIYYSILNPIVQAKKVQLKEMLNKKDEIVKFEKEIKTNKAKIKKIKPDYLKHSTLFHSKEEVEGLYQSLSQHAGINGLVISKIEKKDPIAVTGSSGKKKKTKKKKKKSKKNIVYYKIPVNFEIKGSFLGYIKFKRAVSLSRKMLNFDRETVQLVKGDITGAIVAKGVLTIVGLTNEFH
ncbi:MAG: pilus assembly protein PilO [Alphaproteobacteria bacterium]|jgi:Tfp pilus assembly protein PilO|nr:pilus assembly protein PilO [Alphaproteobacteria bacterium]|tara:strand:+ start:42 stop:698 length:657 start_codon:yes stop_codon:yes gene_type:complete